jgi:hypothetical protein
MFAYNITDSSVTVFLDGDSLTATQDHPKFDEIRLKVINEDTDGLIELFDRGQAVIDYTEGNISVEGGAVLYKGEAVHNVIVDKILGCMSEGVYYKRLIRFLDKLMANPSRNSVQQLYRFLEHKNMPLTPEGDFLAYKGVDSNFKDFWSHKFDNSVGQTLEMPRNGVCDDADKGCSDGFHAGSYDYAKGYASGGGNLMVVQISPADVVSVPHCSDCQKLRTAKYKVVGLCEKIIATESCDDYYDGDNEEEVTNFNEGYEVGYEEAKAEFFKNYSPSQ